MTPATPPAGGAELLEAPLTRAPPGGLSQPQMRQQPKPKLGLRHFLRDLHKADKLFWLTAIVAAGFLLFVWLTG